jgi:hypothetical protein
MIFQNRVNEFSLKSIKLLIFSVFTPDPNWENAKNQQFGKVPIWEFWGKWAF